MERKDGFLILDDLEQLPNDHSIENGVYSYGWFKEQDIYLFKAYSNLLTCYKEMIYAYYASKIGILNVGYDLAKYKGGIGVVSKKYTEHKLVSMKALLLNHLHSIGEKRSAEYCYFHVDFLLFLLTSTYGKQESFSSQTVYQELLLKFIGQILLGNADVNSRNLDFDEESLTFLPLYDLSFCGSIDLKGNSKDNYYYLKRHFTGEIKEHPRNTIQSFFTSATSFEKDIFYTYLENASVVSLGDLFAEIEEHIHIFLPEEANIFKQMITTQLKDIRHLVKKLKRKF